MFTDIRDVFYQRELPPHEYERRVIRLSPNLKIENHSDYYDKITYSIKNTLVVSYDFLLLEDVIQLSYIIDSSTGKLRNKLLVMKFYHTDPTCYEGFPSLDNVFTLHIYTKKDLEDHHIQNVKKFVETKREYTMKTVHGLDFDDYDYSYEIKK